MEWWDGEKRREKRKKERRTVMSGAIDIQRSPKPMISIHIERASVSLWNFKIVHFSRYQNQLEKMLYIL